MHPNYQFVPAKFHQEWSLLVTILISKIKISSLIWFASLKTIITHSSSGKREGFTLFDIRGFHFLAGVQFKAFRLWTSLQLKISFKMWTNYRLQMTTFITNEWCLMFDEEPNRTSFYLTHVIKQLSAFAESPQVQCSDLIVIFLYTHIPTYIHTYTHTYKHVCVDTGHIL